MSKLDLTTDAEYVVNLVNINLWLKTCNSAVYYMGMSHFYNDDFRYDRLKFSYIYIPPK